MTARDLARFDQSVDEGQFFQALLGVELRYRQANAPPSIRALVAWVFRAFADRVKDGVILRSAGGKILLGVIDDLVCAQRFHHVQVLSTANRGHISPKGFGDLDGIGADASRRAIDQHFLPALDFAFAQQAQSSRPAAIGTAAASS